MGSSLKGKNLLLLKQIQSLRVGPFRMEAEMKMGSKSFPFRNEPHSGSKNEKGKVYFLNVNPVIFYN